MLQLKVYIYMYMQILNCIKYLISMICCRNETGIKKTKYTMNFSYPSQAKNNHIFAFFTFLYEGGSYIDKQHVLAP